MEPRSPTLQADSLPAEPEGKPKNTGVGSLPLLQWIFQTQKLNWCLPNGRWILYQLSYQGSPLNKHITLKVTALFNTVLPFPLVVWPLLYHHLKLPWFFMYYNVYIFFSSLFLSHNLPSKTLLVWIIPYFPLVRITIHNVNTKNELGAWRHMDLCRHIGDFLSFKVC